MAGGPVRRQSGCPSSSAHLLGGGDPHERQPAADNLPDAKGEFQTRPRKLWSVFKEEAAGRIVVAAVPQGMELRRQIIEEERDAVRLVGEGRAFDRPRSPPVT